MPELQVIFRTQSDIEASIVRGLLETHGIHTLVSSDVPHSVFPLSINALGEVRISVREADADDALRIIRDHQAEVATGTLVRLREDIEALERRIGYRFRDVSLLERALTHRSHAHEVAPGEVADYESLEFLGDAILGFVVADLLFREFPLLDEGQKSKLKASLVSARSLARLSERLDIGEHIRLGRGEEKSGGRARHALLSDAFEALIAAIYLDGGIGAATTFVRGQLDEDIETLKRSGPLFPSADHKSALQEWLQSRNRPLPAYRVVAETGPDHRKTFEVAVEVDGDVLASALGSTKKAAEQAAAREALESLSRSR